MSKDYRYPFPPFPDGWYVVAFSDELAPGQMKTGHWFGRDLIVFRSESGKAGVMDAICPHMGAHMGRGGRVVGEGVRCPFHGFEFGSDGQCLKTPYGKRPSKARAGVWPVAEKHGLILTSYTADGGRIGWEVPDLDMSEWRPWRHDVLRIRTHPQETTENSVDLGHFAAVHLYKDVEIVREVAVEGPHLSISYQFQRLTPFTLRESHMRTVIEVDVWGLGYSLVEVTIPRYDWTSRILVLPIPTDGEYIELRAAMSLNSADVGKLSPALKLVPASLAARIVQEVGFRSYVHDVKQDIEIWENKRYVHPPALAPGDGPVGQYRLYCKQFYPTGERLQAARHATA